MNKVFEIYLISDATGNTLKTLAQSCLSQFENIQMNVHSFPLVSNEERLNEAISAIKKKPGLVLYTIPYNNLCNILEKFCLEEDIACYDILETPLKVMSAFFKVESHINPGEKHKFDDDTVSKIVAMEYALKYNQHNPDLSELNLADIILVGPSRTSKTPTSVYLANQSLKTASFTFYPDKDLPDELFEIKNKLIIGLIAKPERLIEFRRNRLKVFDPFIQTDYLDDSSVEEEVMKARKLYADNSWPTLDITGRALEDVCDEIIDMLNKYNPELK